MKEVDIQSKLKRIYSGKIDKNGGDGKSRLTPKGTVRPATPKEIEEALKKSRE